MAVNGFLVNNEVQKYNYESLENYNTPDFSSSLTYQVGDYVMYQGKLYRCTTEITTSGGWDSSKWSLAILSDDVADLRSSVESGEYGLSEPVKQAILQIARKVAYIDDQGQTYYDDLYDALYPFNVVSISAVYTQSGTVYDTDTLDSLKTDLVVTATYSDSSTQTVPAADYTLSGTLTVGTSTITVSYGGKTTTFNVTVSEEPIPSDYQQVEYLEATQTSATSGGYFNTGVNSPEHTTLQFVAGFMQSGTQPTASTAQYIISTRQTATDSTNNVGFTIQISGTMDAIGSFSGNPGVYISQATINKRFDVTATWTAASLTVSDGETTATEEYETRGCVGYPICVFGLKKAANNLYTNTFNGRIYYAKAYADGELIVDMVPCYRKSDNVIGMYNKATSSFRTVSGSAAVFTAGPDVT